jgi:hypothetical protein
MHSGLAINIILGSTSFDIAIFNIRRASMTIGESFPMDIGLPRQAEGQ